MENENKFEDEFEETTEANPISELEIAINSLKQQITVAIADGHSALAERKTKTLEKLQKIQTQTPKTLNPMEAVKQRREERDRLFAELERRFERLAGR